MLSQAPVLPPTQRTPQFPALPPPTRPPPALLRVPAERSWASPTAPVPCAPRTRVHDLHTHAQSPPQRPPPFVGQSRGLHSFPSVSTEVLGSREWGREARGGGRGGARPGSRTGLLPAPVPSPSQPLVAPGGCQGAPHRSPGPHLAPGSWLYFLPEPRCCPAGRLRRWAPVVFSRDDIRARWLKTRSRSTETGVSGRRRGAAGQDPLPGSAGSCGPRPGSPPPHRPTRVLHSCPSPAHLPTRTGVGCTSGWRGHVANLSALRPRWAGCVYLCVCDRHFIISGGTHCAPDTVRGSGNVTVRALPSPGGPTGTKWSQEWVVGMQPAGEGPGAARSQGRAREAS